MKTEKSPVGRLSLLGLICFYVTDAINSGGEIWTEYSNTITVGEDVSSCVTEYHAYYNSNARLAKVKFRTSDRISATVYILGGLLHGTSNYTCDIQYQIYTGSYTSINMTISSSGVLTATSIRLPQSGSYYIEIIYPYYS